MSVVVAEGSSWLSRNADAGFDIAGRNPEACPEQSIHQSVLLRCGINLGLRQVFPNRGNPGRTSISAQTAFFVVSTDLRSQRLKEDGRVRVGRTLLSSSALNSFNVCAKVLREQARIWLGVGWIAAALGQSLRKDRVSLPANIRLKPDVVTA